MFYSLSLCTTRSISSQIFRSINYANITLHSFMSFTGFHIRNHIDGQEWNCLHATYRHTDRLHLHRPRTISGTIWKNFHFPWHIIIPSLSFLCIYRSQSSGQIIRLLWMPSLATYNELHHVRNGWTRMESISSQHCKHWIMLLPSRIYVVAWCSFDAGRKHSIFWLAFSWSVFLGLKFETKLSHFSRLCILTDARIDNNHRRKMESKCNSPCMICRLDTKTAICRRLLSSDTKNPSYLPWGRNLPFMNLTSSGQPMSFSRQQWLTIIPSNCALYWCICGWCIRGQNKGAPRFRVLSFFIGRTNSLIVLVSSSISQICR
jgi:hypothetical protein